jgi:hypothetical protein
MQYNEGDIIGVTSRLGNAVVNFIKLFILRDLEYAKKNWRKIRVPSRFYVVCQARQNGLLYGCRAVKKNGKADVEFRALSCLGKVVWVGRSESYKSLVNQMRLNDRVSALHYELTAMKNDYRWFRKKRVLNNRFIIETISVNGIKFNLKHLYENKDCSTLFVIESGNFADASSMGL